MVAYDRDSGEILWTAGDGQLSYSSPMPATIGGLPQAMIATDFGVQAFRPDNGTLVWQHEWRIAQMPRIAMPVVLNNDRTVMLPTGYGKSLIYQVPALLLDRPTIVISPLLALMRDQEQGLQARDIPVVRIDSTVRPKARREALARVEHGGALVVLTTPETLETDDVGAAVNPARPRLLCVDEAHCISEWGHDFRPAYLRIGAERKTLRIPQVLALTATATPRVRTDITARLGLNDPAEILAAPHRPNLRLSAHYAPGNEKITRAGRILRRLQRPGIVYCATTKAVDEIYTALRRARIP